MAHVTMTSSQGRGRFPALDGLRGVLILYIMLHHTLRMAPVLWLFPVLDYGFAAVDAFFVLSGFLLMRSFLQQGSTFPEGLRMYLLRRLRRLLPPYYAGLVLSILVAFLLPFHLLLGVEILHTGIAWQTILQHVLAVQNFFPSTLDDINVTYWFFAMEIQLSLFFPFAALAWRRFGAGPTLSFAAVVIGACFLIVGGGSYFLKMQYVMLFLMGMGVAHAWWQTDGRIAVEADRWLIILIATIVGLAALSVTYAFLGTAVHSPFSILADSGVGLAMIAVLLLCISPTANLVQRVLSTNVLVSLGVLSYALYLLHVALLRLLQIVILVPLGVPPGVQFILLSSVGIAIVCAAAVPFHDYFEGRIVPKSVG